MNRKCQHVVERQIGKIAIASAFLMSALAFAAGSAAPTPVVVVAVSGCGVPGATETACAIPNGTGATVPSQNATPGGYGDNQASPLSLFYFQASGKSSAALKSVLVLPQAASGSNMPVSAEYGSSSEDTLQLSGNSTYLTIMGYGINAAIFDAAYAPGFTTDPYGAAPSGALAQSGSLTLANQTESPTYTPVPRVAALIDQNGNVTSSTQLFNVFNTNNPRSIYTADGTTSAYVSGQGSGCDLTGGVFYTALGGVNTAPTAITGADASGLNSSCVAVGAPSSINQDTRDVQVYGTTPTLYISVDSTEGKSFNRSFVGTLGTPPSTALYVPSASDPYATGPTMLKGFGNNGGTGRVQLTAAQTNGLVPAGTYINLSPQNYFFASSTVFYVADGGTPKQTSADSETTYSLCGAGGLQKWVLVGSTWTWEYTLSSGLNLVKNANTNSGDTSCSTNTDGATGLYGLTGMVSNATAYLYATNFNIADLDPTYLYGITDCVSATTAGASAGGCTTGQTTFTKLATAPPDSNFKGVSLSPLAGTTLPLTNGVTIASVPTGLQFNSVGTGCAPGTYTTPMTLNWTPGSSCTVIMSTPQNSAGVQYTFSQWQDGTTNPTYGTTAPSSPTIYTATFATTPTITWPAPAAITYGSALGNGQLNATASVPGTFVYSPAPGTVLPVGSNEALSVSFTPTDTVHYTTATGSTTITVNPAAPPASPANLVVTKVLTRTGGNVVVTLTIANTGRTAAANVVLSSVKVGADTATPLPQAIGTIGAGSSATTSVSVPGSVGASGAASSLTLSGTYTGGTFSSSARITLP